MPAPKFNTDADYLFYTGTIAFISVWYFGIETKDAQGMLIKAKKLNSNNPVYNWNSLCFDWFGTSKPVVSDEVKAYARLVLQKDSAIRRELEPLGSLGRYFLELMEYMANEIIDHEQKKS
jgi:hypothetical protein